jgi:hypothetical protein
VPTELQNKRVAISERLEIDAHYSDQDPFPCPDHDFRVGVGFRIGEWYR